MKFTIRPDICLKDNQKWGDLPEIVYTLVGTEQELDWTGGSFDYHKELGSYESEHEARCAARRVVEYLNMDVIEFEIPTEGKLLR